MTTIAWDGHTLAADQASWSNGVKRRVCKLHRFDDGLFAGVGDGAFVEAYAAFRRGERALMPDAQSYNVEKSETIGVFIRRADWRIFSVTSLGELLPINEKHYATGAGQEFAWGALDAGASAVEAVKIAMYRSDYAGIGVDSMTMD